MIMTDNSRTDETRQELLPELRELAGRLSLGARGAYEIIRELDCGIDEQRAAIVDFSSAINVLSQAASVSNRYAALATIYMMDVADIFQKTALCAGGEKNAKDVLGPVQMNMSEISEKTVKVVQAISDIVRSLSVQETTIARIMKSAGWLYTTVRVNAEKTEENMAACEALSVQAAGLAYKITGYCDML